MHALARRWARGIVALVFASVTAASGACGGAARDTQATPRASSSASASPSASASASPSASAASEAPVEHGLALCLLLDRSGSMTGRRIEMARAAALTALEELGDDDRFELVAFDSRATIVVPLGLGSRRDPARKQIASIEPAGGTEYGDALRIALDDVAPMTGMRRLVVLLTDGQAPLEGVFEAVRALRAKGAWVSTVGIGEADAKTLARIAQTGGGKAYFVDDPNELPEVVRREIARVRPK